MNIPISEMVIGDAERAALGVALDARQIATGDFVKEFEAHCARVTGRAHAISCTNGTVALALALRALDIGAGDEVICPTFTFSGTAAAITHVGATPVLVDVNPDTWCISIDAVRAAVSDRTKAVIAVDLFGVPCDYGVLEPWCAERGIALVVDAAESIGGSLSNRPCGSFGTIATMSFYENKIVAAGEGGACVTNDETCAGRMTQLKNHGARSGTHGVCDVPGYNFRMTNLHAALACAQFGQLENFLRRRSQTDNTYRTELGDVPSLTFQQVPPHARSSHWMTGVLYAGDVRALTTALATQGIETRPFFVPIHDQPYAAAWEHRGAGFPVADDLHARGICLPNGNTTTSEQVAFVCEQMKMFC